MKFVRFCLIAWIGLFAMNHLSWTQEALGGTIGGTVVDKLGKPLKEAKVAAKNIDTELETTCNTDEHGAYELSDLAAGNYSVIARKDGYMTTMYKNVPVQTGKRVKLKIKLGPPGVRFID
jgi:uncharacterized GH25 family protein